MSHVPTLIVGLKTVTLVLGGLVTFFSYKAYSRTGSPALRALALGFGAITLGALLAGITDQFLVADRDIALVVESLLTAVGFAIITYSLYVTE
jgi:divalent metal cation (Fe/Co/Zn/Cd) transporter